MTSQADLDMLLSAWLSEGSERVPERYVSAALDRVAITNQRRATRWGSNERQWRLATFALAALLVAIVGIGITLGVGLIRIPVPTPNEVPAPSQEPMPNPTPDASAATDEGELVTYADPEGLFDMRMPRAWAAEPSEGRVGEMTRTLGFGVGSGFGTTESPGLRIFIGSDQGTIAKCPDCPEVAIRTLDDLEEFVVSTPSFSTDGPPEAHETLTLGGESARSERPGISNDCLGCPDFYYHVFTIHGGRPIVLAFDYWNIRFGRITVPGGRDVPFSRAKLETILASFRFLDGAVVEEDGTFVGPDGSFAIALPSSWELAEGSDPSAIHFGDGTIALSIRSATPGGSLLTCDTFSPTFEQCVSIAGSTVDELAAGIMVPRHADPPTMWVGPNETPITLDGEPAMLMTMVGTDRSRGMRPVSLAYVIAIHEGRPFLIRAYRPDGEGVAELEGLLEGFRFR